MIDWLHQNFLMFIVAVVNALASIFSSFLLGLLVVIIAGVFIYMAMRLRHGCRGKL